MNRIDVKFKQLRASKKKAFIAFITAGFPDLRTTEQLIFELEKKGVDIIELGVPFSDPLADGPIIQYASAQALKKNVHLKDILDLVKRVRENSSLPICLMTYYNPIFSFGEEKFIKRAVECGVDGVIIPDLPPEEGAAFIKYANKSNIDIICFLSPTTTANRIKFVSGVSRGFIYYVSLTGVTGIRKDISSDLKNKLKIIKSYTTKPLCVGFGVSTHSQVRQIQQVADGVIVGSAIVKAIKDNIGKADLIKRVGSFVQSLL